MARYHVNQDWSAPIAIAAGDIVENRGQSRILLCADIAAPSDDNALTLRPKEKRTVPKALTVVAKTVLRTSNNLFVISGFADASAQPLV